MLYKIYTLSIIEINCFIKFYHQVTIIPSLSMTRSVYVNDDTDKGRRTDVLTLTLPVYLDSHKAV